ncbi:MAG TPA: hypothetical protein VFJ95_05240 [Gammaproteobacteria bacterium]|nr:hypothetical protein [Gammaproteobacteria bacterium]
MEQFGPWAGLMLGLSSVGFYAFLAVWVGGTIWARTKEKLAVQETLRKLVDSGTALTPEVIDALRRPKPKRAPEEVRAAATRYWYWGLFLAMIGGLLELLNWSGGSPARAGGGVILFVIPGLFCLAHSLITRRTQQ